MLWITACPLFLNFSDPIVYFSDSWAKMGLQTKWKGSRIMWGIGKPRSKLGKWLDRKGLEQKELSKASKVDKNTITKACNDKDYIPRQDVMKKLLKAIREIDPGANMSDFWDM
jgi:predicted transcriptional regulator